MQRKLEQLGIRAWVLSNVGPKEVPILFVGVPYHNCSIVGPKTLFQLLRPLYYPFGSTGCSEDRLGFWDQDAGITVQDILRVQGSGCRFSAWGLEFRGLGLVLAGKAQPSSETSVSQTFPMLLWLARWIEVPGQPHCSPGSCLDIGLGVLRFRAAPRLRNSMVDLPANVKSLSC